MALRETSTDEISAGVPDDLLLHISPVILNAYLEISAEQPGQDLAPASVKAQEKHLAKLRTFMGSLKRTIEVNTRGMNMDLLRKVIAAQYQPSPPPHPSVQIIERVITVVRDANPRAREREADYDQTLNAYRHKNRLMGQRQRQMHRESSTSSSVPL